MYYNKVMTHVGMTDVVQEFISPIVAFCFTEERFQMGRFSVTHCAFPTSIVWLVRSGTLRFTALTDADQLLNLDKGSTVPHD